MANSLKDFYQDVQGEVIEEAPVAPVANRRNPTEASPSGSAATYGLRPSAATARGMDIPQAPPAHQVIDAGRQYEELAGSHKALTDLMHQAKSGNQAALQEIVRHYSFEPSELAITITKPLRDAHGKEPEKFGMKLIHSEEEWAAMARDWETAAAYFPGIELHNMPTTRRGKRLAVVMGVTAQEFNAVIAAERRRENLEKAMHTYASEIEKGRKEMGVDKMSRVPAGKDSKPRLETPPTREKQGQVISLPKR